MYCRTCRYDLHETPVDKHGEGVCPECGTAFDPKKNSINLRRHKVSLTEGDGVLNDPLALTIEDDFAEGEQ